MVYTRCSEIVADVREDMRQQVHREKDLGNTERRFKKFKKMLVETCDEHYDYYLYTLK